MAIAVVAIVVAAAALRLRPRRGQRDAATPPRGMVPLGQAAETLLARLGGAEAGVCSLLRLAAQCGIPMIARSEMTHTFEHVSAQFLRGEGSFYADHSVYAVDGVYMYRDIGMAKADLDHLILRFGGMSSACPGQSSPGREIN